MDHDPDFLYTTPLTALAREFSYRGMAILSPQQLGIPASVHQRVYAQEKLAWEQQQPITPSSIPEILQVLTAPGLDAAVKELIGENWAVVPFTHNAPFCSGAYDQQWHKDDNNPYNGRRMRHHQSVQLEMIYYPQMVTELMGPTATIPYSHYWTFNHEENPDNFAGADHLDFDYLLSGMEHIPVSGPDSPYAAEDILQRRTAHDQRMRDKVKDTGWPLVLPLEAAPLQAGSVLLYSHNTFHRGNHRRDDSRNWNIHPRFMWRFYLYRTTDPKPRVLVPEISWQPAAVDPLTGVDVSAVDENVNSVWRYHYHWLKSGGTASHQKININMQQMGYLFQQLQVKHDTGEAQRIGAAYQLASCDDTVQALHYLQQGFYAERENIRRASMYGLIALGAESTATLLQAAQSDRKWLRKAAFFALGEMADLNHDTVQLFKKCLEQEESVYVRSVAAAGIGCLLRRALAADCGVEWIPQCTQILIESLRREQNRCCMSAAQGRSIKLVRPTDDCDVCEGNGVDFGIARFQRLRSTVRENALWSLVVLSAHGPENMGEFVSDVKELLCDIINNEENVIVYGYAMDALNRLTKSSTACINLLRPMPIHCCESLVRGGMSIDDIEDINAAAATSKECVSV